MKFRTFTFGLTTGVAAYIGIIFAQEASKDVDFNVIAAPATGSKEPTLKKVPCGSRSLPSRGDQLESIKASDAYDVLIIGGGATGTGCALESVTRGLKTALVEAGDFGSKTSSRSSKLLCGGIRYLKESVMHFDGEQFRMVKDSLRERAHIVNNSPNLTKIQPIIIPIYSWWKLPFYWVGLKFYDCVAGCNFLKLSHFITKGKVKELLPVIETDGLCGGIVYYEALHDDARMNLSIAMTAARYGANVVNYVEVLELLKNKSDQVCAVRVRDNLTGNVFDIRSRCIINATGPYIDSIRKMDNPKAEELVVASCGSHIVMPRYLSPYKYGILCVPKEDSRVLMVLPWENHTMVGTTDLDCKPEPNPAPTEKDILTLLTGLRDYLSADVKLRREDVLAAWSGVRPLVRNPSADPKKDTEHLARQHVIEVSKSNLITIAGGRWTTYRLMAEDTINRAIKVNGFKPRRKKSHTPNLKLDGGHDWTPKFYVNLVQTFNLDEDIARHLSEKYGTRAYELLSHCGCSVPSPEAFRRLHCEFPYTEHEIRYCVKEYACTAIDMIARRTRIAFLNTEAALKILPTIVDIMGEELNWECAERESQFKKAREFLLNEMGHCNDGAVARKGCGEKTDSKVESNDLKEFGILKDEKGVNQYENKYYLARFKRLDYASRGYAGTGEVFYDMKRLSRGKITDEMLLQIMHQVKTENSGRYNFKEYTRLISVLQLYLAKEKHAKEV